MWVSKTGIKSVYDIYFEPKLLVNQLQQSRVEVNQAIILYYHLAYIHCLCMQALFDPCFSSSNVNEPL